MEKSNPRFWSKVTYCCNTGCWIWTGAATLTGYGKIAQAGGRQEQAHRLSYKLHYNCDPAEKLVCHTCDNKWCVNPRHLFLGTQKDNMRDCSRKKRFTRFGERNAHAKLVEADVRFIRTAPGTLSEIARQYGVTPSTISKIVKRQTWRHVLP